jgi:DNA-binding transcriptional regulator YdaS (Cro superfamily)
MHHAQLLRGGASLSTPQAPVIESAADLRAGIARQMVPLYQLAPRVGLHPAHLGQVLRGKRPLSPELAERIRRALDETPEAERIAHVAA